MAPEHKFSTAAKICSEVLTAFADSQLSLDQAQEVLRDSLAILASKEIKVCNLTVEPGDPFMQADFAMQSPYLRILGRLKKRWGKGILWCVCTWSLTLSFLTQMGNLEGIHLFAIPCFSSAC